MNHTVQYWVGWVSGRNSKPSPVHRPVTIDVGDGDRPNGVRITLPNGLTTSIQWGTGNYCSRRGHAMAYEDHYDAAGSVDAEVAIWNKDDEWYRLSEHREVIGWQSVAEVEKLLDKASLDINFAPRC